MPTSARPAPCRRAFHTPPLYICFLVMPPAAPLSCRRKRGERRVGAGDSDFPLLDVPPRKGGYASPSGAAGALQRKPPPSESRQQDGSGETPRRGNRNSPFLVVSRGMGVGKGENRNSPFPTGSFAPFWPLRKGPAGGLTRKQVSKRVPMEGAPARHKAGRCRQKVNCLREAKEAAPTVERTAHKTRPVSGPYLRRNTWTRKEARTRRPSRAASRSAPSLGVFQ